MTVYWPSVSKNTLAVPSAGKITLFCNHKGYSSVWLPSRRLSHYRWIPSEAFGKIKRDSYHQDTSFYPQLFERLVGVTNSIMFIHKYQTTELTRVSITKLPSKIKLNKWTNNFPLYYTTFLSCWWVDTLHQATTRITREKQDIRINLQLKMANVTAKTSSSENNIIPTLGVTRKKKEFLYNTRVSVYNNYTVIYMHFGGLVGIVLHSI